MSLPFYTFTCSGCDFTSSYSYHTEFNYAGIAEREPAIKSALCRECNKIVNAFTPFTAEDAMVSIQDCQMWIAHNKRGFLSKFSRTKQEEISRTQNQILAIQKRASYFQENKFTSKCVHCGSDNLELFNISIFGDGAEEYLDLKHSCGGNLNIRMSGRMFFQSRSFIKFDEIGNVLLNEKCKLRLKEG